VSPGTEPEQRRVVPTSSDEQRAAFRRTEEVIARIQPSWLPDNRKLCAGCGQVIYRDLRNCGGVGARSSIERGFATGKPSSSERYRSTAGHFEVA
jgi:hypothetical protein